MNHEACFLVSNSTNCLLSYAYYTELKSSNILYLKEGRGLPDLDSVMLRSYLQSRPFIQNYRQGSSQSSRQIFLVSLDWSVLDRISHIQASKMNFLIGRILGNSMLCIHG